MKRINQPVIALVAVGMFSAPAGAGFTVDHSNYRIYSQGNGATITATPIGEEFGGIAGPFAPIYDSIGTSDGLFCVGPGGTLIDDYTSIAAPGTYDMTQMRFAGGVDVVTGVLFFDFFDTGGGFIDGFGVAFPVAGNFVWSITVGNGRPFFLANEAGFMQITADDGTFGFPPDMTWFFTQSPVAVGSNVGTPFGELGDDVTTIYEFALFIPSLPPSAADISGPGGPGVPDGCVDAFDLGTLLGAWCSSASDPDPPGDIDPPCEGCTSPNFALADISGVANVPDGCVDAFDLAKLLAQWCSVAGGNPCGTCQ